MVSTNTKHRKRKWKWKKAEEDEDVEKNGINHGEDHCRLKCRVQALALPLHEFMTWSTRYEECSPSRDCTGLSDLLNERIRFVVIFILRVRFSLRVCAQSITFACSSMFRIYAGKWFKLSVSQIGIILEEFILSIASHTSCRMNEMMVTKTTERVRQAQPNQSRYDFFVPHFTSNDIEEKTDEFIVITTGSLFLFSFGTWQQQQQQQSWVCCVYKANARFAIHFARIQSKSIFFHHSK